MRENISKLKYFQLLEKTRVAFKPVGELGCRESEAKLSNAMLYAMLKPSPVPPNFLFLDLSS